MWNLKICDAYFAAPSDFLLLKRVVNTCEQTDHDETLWEMLFACILMLFTFLVDAEYQRHGGRRRKQHVDRICPVFIHCLREWSSWLSCYRCCVMFQTINDIFSMCLMLCLLSLDPSACVCECMRSAHCLCEMRGRHVNFVIPDAFTVSFVVDMIRNRRRSRIHHPTCTLLTIGTTTYTTHSHLDTP